MIRMAFDDSPVQLDIGSFTLLPATPTKMDKCKLLPLY